jgi:flagellar biosynthesis/type III secretory pathway ATPase
VLVEGDDMTEPIADAAKGILDGHIVLSRKLAERAHFPAIDILASISRVADQVSDQNHLRARRHLSRLLSAYKEAEELIQIGAYAKGSNAEVDAAIALKPMLEAFLRQGSHERCDLPVSLRGLVELSLSAASADKRSTPQPPGAGRPPAGVPISR